MKIHLTGFLLTCRVEWFALTASKSVPFQQNPTRLEQWPGSFRVGSHGQTSRLLFLEACLVVCVVSAFVFLRGDLSKLWRQNRKTWPRSPTCFSRIGLMGPKVMALGSPCCGSCVCVFVFKATFSVSFEGNQRDSPSWGPAKSPHFDTWLARAGQKLGAHFWVCSGRWRQSFCSLIPGQNCDSSHVNFHRHTTATRLRPNSEACKDMQFARNDFCRKRLPRGTASGRSKGHWRLGQTSSLKVMTGKMNT